MGRGAIVPGRVLAGGVVAAPDVPALLAYAQMHPVMPPHGQALDAARTRWDYIFDVIEVPARFDHESPQSTYGPLKIGDSPYGLAAMSIKRVPRRASITETEFG
jgi:hypothetical protein